MSSESIPIMVVFFPELASALPMEDVLALGGLIGVHQTRIWTCHRIEECKKHLDALIAINNIITPINTLPNELLMKIFASIGIDTWRSAPWMLTMSHICRRWRAVVLVTPEFWVKPLQHWGDLENDHQQNHLLPIFLERSSPCPLQLHRFERSSSKNFHGWEPHFGRLTVLQAFLESDSDVPKILRKITAKMKRLERLKLEVVFDSSYRKEPLELDIRPWKAERLPFLGRLEISGEIFCRATTVPSLHTLVLFGRGGLKFLPRLLDGLEGCPALARVHLNVNIWLDVLLESTGRRAPAVDSLRVVDLPNLRQLRITGKVLVIRTLLSHISFPPSATRLELVVRGGRSDPEKPPVLPDILPRRLSILHMSPTIDRLFLQSDLDYSGVPFVSVRGYVHGVERLRVSPAVWLHSADRLFQLLEVFVVCTVTELALDLRGITSGMGGEFWGQFFAALPDLRRLQLLSCTLESKEIKRDIAERFLASSRESQRTAHVVSLAWVVRADKKNPLYLKQELRDVGQVLGGHAQHGGRLGRLELHVTSLEPRSCDPTLDEIETQVVDITQVSLDRTTKWLLERDFVSQLAQGTEVVAVSGQLKLQQDDDGGEEDVFEGGGMAGDDELEEWRPEMGEDEYEDEKWGSSDDME